MIESFFRSARNQSGYWLHTGRLRGYSVVIIVVYVLSAVAWIATSEGLVDPTDKPLGYDFIAFFSASKIALDGDFVAVFDQMQMLAVQQEVIPGNRSIYTWNYPPQFLVVVLPLALLPYVAAFFAWTIASLGLYLLVVPPLRALANYAPPRRRVSGGTLDRGAGPERVRARRAVRAAPFCCWTAGRFSPAC